MSMSESIERTLGRIEEQLNGVRASLEDSRTEVRSTLTTHNARIAGLERWQSRLVGGAAVVGFLFGAILKLWH